MTTQTATIQSLRRLAMEDQRTAGDACASWQDLIALLTSAAAEGLTASDLAAEARRATGYALRTFEPA